MSTIVLAPGTWQWLPLPYGHFGALLNDPLAYHEQMRLRFGDVYRLRIGPFQLHFLYHPEHVRRVLFENPKNYVRGWQYRLMNRLFGENLVASEGASWLRQRRLTQPAFYRQRLRGYANVMVDATAQMLAQWSAAKRHNVDIAFEMKRLALTIAGRTLFDRDVGHDADSVGQAFGIVGQYLEMRFNNPFSSMPGWVPTSTNREFHRAKHKLFEIVLELIQERRREGRDHGDLLSMLMSARDEETRESMSDDQLRSQSLAFLIAGHETTATALTWTWYLLAKHTSIQQEVRAEVDQVLEDRLPTIDDLVRLQRTRQVLEEAMRLFPPVWTIPRHLVASDKIGGFAIPRGSMIVLVPYMTHRHPDFWQEPHVFDPARFAPQNTAKRPKGAYFPFLGGPHQCIGSEFAMMEMQLVVAMTLREFVLELVPDQVIRPKASISLRPDGPVSVVLAPIGCRAVRPIPTTMEHLRRSGGG